VHFAATTRQYSSSLKFLLLSNNFFYLRTEEDRHDFFVFDEGILFSLAARQL
jgi:hypothetical protein